MVVLVGLGLVTSGAAQAPKPVDPVKEKRLE